MAMEALANNPNMPIDEMPDCPQKLEKIRRAGEKYNDMQFDH